MDRVDYLTPRGLTLERLETPLGELLIVADESGVRAIDFADCDVRLMRMIALFAMSLNGRRSVLRPSMLRDMHPPATPGQALIRLKAYFEGDLRAIDAISARPAGTPFQQSVWSALRRIPPGVRTTYGALAARTGQPLSPRAVGMANATNPVSVVIPCHRLTGADGTLTGYAGGLARKEWLLSHEGGVTPPALPPALPVLP